MSRIIYPNDRGLVVLYDGTEVYMVDFQYSVDGKTYWESHYNGGSHFYENDGITKLEGHKYIRFKRAGSIEWDNPARFIGIDGVDGDNLELQVTKDRILQYKLSKETTWTNLFDLEELRGEQGPMGQGWNIDKAGALDTRESCCGDTHVNTCNTCNPNSTATCGLSTYLSLGNHRVNETDVLNGTTYWHSVDGVTWIQTTTSNIGEYVCAWRATNGTGTNALTCNSQGYVVAFISLVTPYISKGRVYVCADGMWTEVMNITQPTGYVKTSAQDGLQFLEAKVDDVTLEAYDSGIGYNDNIRIKDDGVNEYKIIDSSLGDGLDGGSGVKITVDPTDFIGFGLKEYASLIDTLNNIQVAADVLCGDGLEPQNETTVDGEDRDLFKVKLSDLINSPNATNTQYTGLATSTQEGFTEEDGFDNLFVKEGDCINNDTKGVNVVADELTIAALDEDKLRVWETDSNTLGIQAKHIHKNAANELHGIEKDNDTTGSFSVKLDTIESPQPLIFNVNGEITVNDNGIQGKYLNDNTCDETKGVEILNDKIVVKVDDTSIEFNGSGQLQVVEAYIQSLIDAGVLSLVVPGQGNMTGDIIFNVTNDSGLISLNIAGAGANDGVITFTTDVDENALTTFITNVINSIVTDASVYSRLKGILKAGTGITLTTSDLLSTITINATATVPSAGSVQTIDGTKADGTLDTYARADHKHDVADNALTIAKTAGLQGELDSKIELNTPYGSGQVSSNGLLIQSPNGTWFLLQVNDNGDLDTRKV